VSEYKVKFRITRGSGLMFVPLESIEVYEAENAKDAIKMAEEEFEKQVGEGYAVLPPRLEILDVEKL
jgi:hypothetical protein